MSTSTTVICGIPFTRKPGYFQANLPADKQPADYEADLLLGKITIRQDVNGHLSGYINGDNLGWEHPDPPTIEDAVQRVLSVVRRRAARIVHALEDERGPIFTCALTGATVRIANSSPSEGPMVMVRWIDWGEEEKVPISSLVLGEEAGNGRRHG